MSQTNGFNPADLVAKAVICSIVIIGLALGFLRAHVVEERAEAARAKRAAAASSAASGTTTAVAPASTPSTATPRPKVTDYDRRRPFGNAVF